MKSDYIDFAKNDELLENEEFDFACAVKNKRNSVFHKVGKKISWN